MASETLLTAADFEAAALAYYESLPLEHFMESTDTATQREIACASFRVLRTRRPGIRLYNEILYQWIEDGEIARLVSDNALFEIDESLDHKRTSFNFDIEPHRPLMDMEWISESDLKKDQEGGATFEKNERLGVPYYLCFNRSLGIFQVFQHDGQGYERMRRQANGRYLIPEVDLEVGLVAGWVRFWYQGELLPLPEELVAQLAEHDELLELKDEQLASKDEQLASKDEEIERLRQQLRDLQSPQ